MDHKITVHNEVQELKARVLRTDISILNPGIQQIVEDELLRWVESYNSKKNPSTVINDCYGGHGEIPDKIYFDGQFYTPNQILEHVKARDEIGSNLLLQLGNMHRTLPSIKEDIDPRQAIVETVPDDANLDQIVVTCACGEHNKTYRNMMMDIININPDSTFLTVGWSDAIMRLYHESEETVNISQPNISRLKSYYTRAINFIRKISQIF